MVVAGNQADGAYTVLYGEADPNIGPPLHRHLSDHEVFHILEGSVLFEIDGQQRIANAGEVVGIPPGEAHRYLVVGETRAKMVLWVQPAGIDEFFIELDAELKRPGPPDMQSIAELHAKYGMELLGPPLSAEPDKVHLGG